MKKMRYAYLGLSVILAVGLNAPLYTVFAEPVEEVVQEDIVADEDVPGDPEEHEEKLNVVIKSYNPGFSDPYVGEFFEIVRLSKDFILLAGLSVIYETSSGSEYLVYEFSDEDEMVGESLLFRLASSNEVKDAEDATKVADLTYTRNMSQSAGRIKLKLGDEMIDSLCWGLKETGCLEAFKTGKKNKPTTLVREISDEEIGEFRFLEDYAPVYDPDKPGFYRREVIEEVVEPQCRALKFTELFTYYETSATEQFIELFNESDEEVELDGCFINYKGKNYALTGKIGARSFKAIRPLSDLGIALTKNPTSANKLLIIDTDGEVVDSLTYYSGQKKGVSLVLVGYRNDGSKNWEQTYSPTPGTENDYQQFKTCPVGKVINLETGNCVNDTALATTTLAACPAGKYRNPLTGRCKSYATTASATLKPCAEGYERNPETNRCRKIVQNTGADYPVVTSNVEEKTELVSIWAIATVITAGIGYIIFQYRDELKMKLARR